MSRQRDMDCAAVDELAPAYGLGALDASEARAFSAHLARCRKPHSEAVELVEAAVVVPMSLEPVTPSAGLRARIMTSVAATPQEHSAPEAVVRAPAGGRRRWWSMGALPSALVAATLVAAIGVGAWGASLNSQLADRNAVLQAIASADAVYTASGPAGGGVVVESGDAAMFMTEDLAELAPEQIYQLWLIHSDGTTVAVGTLDDANGVTIVTLERDLGAAVSFAMTVEAERVEQPTGEPVLTAQLGA